MSGWVARQPASAVILVAGLVVAFAAYVATSTRASDAAPDFTACCLGRVPVMVLSSKDSHFDPLTGEPRAWAYTTNHHGFGETQTVGPVPADMVGRRAIPLPLGFAIGMTIGFAIVAVARRRSPTMVG